MRAAMLLSPGRTGCSFRRNKRLLPPGNLNKRNADRVDFASELFIREPQGSLSASPGIVFIRSL